MKNNFTSRKKWYVLFEETKLQKKAETQSLFNVKHFLLIENEPKLVKIKKKAIKYIKVERGIG